MNVCVVGGGGYVGLITGLGLAELGHHVIGVDIDQERLGLLQAGHLPIHEAGLEVLLRRNLAEGRIRFSARLQEAVAASDVVFIAVGTPAHQEGHADPSQVLEAAEGLAQCLDSYKVVVIKSTVPVGTVEAVRGILGRQWREGEHFDIVANPEFLREGQGLQDFFFPDRIVIGAQSERARAMVRNLYEPILRGKVSWSATGSERRRSGTVPLIETDLASAQMIKYASNAFLATRISFINEIAGLCEKVGADIKEVVRGVGDDPRIGHVYMQAGLGFGGPCLEKDLDALIEIGVGNGYEPRLLRAVMERNEEQVEEAIAKLQRLIGESLHDKFVAVFGLAFKAGTDDVRNSLALKVVDRLESEGATVRAHDPVAISGARAMRPGLSYHEDPYEAVHRADALLVLTEWPQFNALDYRAIKSRMASPRILDMRNLLDGGALRGLGFTYVGVGRP